MSSRKKLDELTKERYVRTGTMRPLPENMKIDRPIDYFVQTDWEVLYAMFEKLSGTAIKVASLMLRDFNHFTSIFDGTYAEVQEELNMSDKPIKDAMVELQQVDFIRKYKNGRYMINPAVGIGCSKDFLNKLRDRYEALQPYISKKNTRRTQNVD